MAGPWEKYGAAEANGPWNKYRQEPKNETSTLEDVGRSAMAGLRKGVESTIGGFADVADVNARGAAWALEKVGLSPDAAKSWSELTKAVIPGAGMSPRTDQVQAVTDPVIGEGYEPQTTAGKYTETASEFAPAAALGPGRLITKLLTQAAIPGLASEGAGQLAHEVAPQAEPYARVIAALLAPLGTHAARRAVTPFPADAEHIRLADTLAHEGVDVTAGQRTGSKTLRYMESELGGGAAQDFATNQGEQFTHAALTRAGIDAPRATPEVMDQAFRRIGGEFDNLAQTTRVPFDTQLQNDLLAAAQDYNEATGTSARAPLIENIMHDAADLASRTGALEGPAYARLRTRITDSMRRGDSNTRGALHDMLEGLDDAVERHLPADTVDRWQAARRQYRNMLVIEQAATGAGENTARGLISPSALRNATLQRQGRRAYARGDGDFADLARAGEGVMKPLPDSGTASRTNARNIGAGILSGVGGIAGLTHGGMPGAAAGIAAGAAVPAIIGRLILSNAGRTLLGNQVLGAGTNPMVQAVIAALTAAHQQQQRALPAR